MSMGPTLGMYAFECSDAAQRVEFWAQVMGNRWIRARAPTTRPRSSMARARRGCRVAGAPGSANGFMLDLTDPAYERIARVCAERVSDNEQDGIRWTVFGDPDGTRSGCSAPALRADHRTPLPQERPTSR